MMEKQADKINDLEHIVDSLEATVADQETIIAAMRKISSDQEESLSLIHI